MEDKMSSNTNFPTFTDTMNFNSIHFNIMHDPWEMSLSRTPKHARSEIILYLKKQQIIHNKYKDDIISLKNLIINSRRQDVKEGQVDPNKLYQKLRQTDLYRNQNFAVSHKKIAKAIKYEL